MPDKHPSKIRIGLLGGGQLGRMLLQESVNLDLDLHIMDPADDAPCSKYSRHFVHGDFRDYDSVLAFGKDKDIVTIEFEDVNADALQELEDIGIKVYPQPGILKIIQDKGLQKQFYEQHGIPTVPFRLIEHKNQLAEAGITFPVFQKLRRGGYDGYGVRKIHSPEDLSQAFDAPSVIEPATEISREISVIVARNARGQVSVFPPVEMVFDPEAHMVRFLLAPAGIDETSSTHVRNIATQVAEKLGMVGLLAVEMFITPDGKAWVNEIAPRPHNSGHHTIEANITSQYEAHLRSILNLYPGDTSTLHHAAMVNLLGEKGFTGTPVYEGLAETLEIPGTYIHLYGKSQTKPFRKMGHITVIGTSAEEVTEKAEKVSHLLKVKA